MSQDPPIDRQAGVRIGDFVSDSKRTVAGGDRREETHYVADADQLTHVSHMVKPAILPPDEVTRETSESSPAGVEDVGVVPQQPSVWDAAPGPEGDRHAGRKS
jgi:hypothetical protein